MKIALIDRFDAGITNDPRKDGNFCRVMSNFDMLTNPRKLTPYHDSESGDNAPTTSQKQNFAVALRTGTTYSLYSLGVKSGASTAEVLYKDLSTLDTSGWSTPSNNQSASGATSFNLFTYYAKTGLIYGAKAGTTIWAFSPSGAAFDDSQHSLSYTNIAEGLVHSKDDIMYIPYDNKIAKNDNGSWADAALTIANGYNITSIFEHGDYLGIVAAPLNGVGSNRILFWNRNESTPYLAENLSFGEGTCKLMASIGGEIIGVGLYGSNSTRFVDRVVFKVLNGSKFDEVLVLEGGTATQLPSAKQVIDNRLWFMMQISLNGSTREGVWSIGRKSDGTFALVHERTPNNDTALTSGVLKSFIKVGDYLFQSFVDNTAFNLMKTNDQASYTATSILETKINPGMPKDDTFKRKKLLAVAVFTEKLSGSGQIVVKHRVDGGSYSSTFLTHTTSTVASDGATDLLGCELDGNGQIATGREFEFRIESTGGAVVTGLAYLYDDTMKSTVFI